MTRPRSLRGRLVLAYTLLAAVTVSVAAAGTLALVERVVWAPIDAAIEEEAETLAVLVDRNNPPELARAVAGIGGEQDLGKGKFVRVLAPDGAALAKSGENPFASSAPTESATRFATVGSGSRAYRVVWYPDLAGGWTEIGVRAERPLSVLQRARWAIWGIAAALLSILVVLALVVTGRATGELGRLASELETIEEGSLHRRLSAQGSQEVDRMAAVLNRLLARLESAMGRLRCFTADAAHELRTPITTLRAGLEVAIRRAHTAEELRDGLIDALEQTERLTRLAEDLLMLNLIESGETEEAMEPVALEDVVREAAEFFQPLADEERRRFDYATEAVPRVHGRATLLKRLLLNLVGNAFRHTPIGCPIRVELRSQRDSVVLEVRDEGPGIPHAEVATLFERFRRGKMATAGTGLGLAICREIVNQHRGRISLESAAGVGTTVTVFFPARAARV